jgi:hypothetical protein
MTTNNTIIKVPGSGNDGFMRLYFNDQRFWCGRYYSGATGTTGKFLDPAAWYHIVFRHDSTQQTGNDRMRIYVNGVREDGGISQDIGQNDDNAVNNNTNQQLFGPSGSERLDGLVADFYMIDGQSLAPTEFGETDEDYGHWKPKKYTGTYGSQGYHLEFKQTGSGQSASTAGADTSGNGNHFDAVNVSAHDQMLDTPTNNFCTMNPNNRDWLGAVRSKATLSQSNLHVVTTTGDTRTSGNMAVNRDGQKYYWEVCLLNSVSAWVGIHDPELSDGARVLYRSDGYKSLDGSTTSGLATYGAGDIIGVAVDEPNNQITFYKNNSSQGTLSYTFQDKQTYLPTVWRSGSGNAQWVFNFGQDSSFAGNKTAQGNGDYDFYYTPPSGFKALCTKDLPDPDVNPYTHFKAVTYSGNGSTSNNGNTITGVGFQPDFVWVKNINGSNTHTLQDSSRGARATIYTQSNEGENSNRGYLNSFTTDGFTTGNANGASVNPSNGSNLTYAAWNWRCNGGTTAAENAGNINATVQANQDAGFSIVTYTGVGGDNKTIEHGLSKAPEMIVIKKRNGNANWVVWNHMMADNYAFESQWLGSAVSGGTPSKYVDSVTSTLVELGDAGENNQDNDTYVMYCWHSVAGFSKFGEYEGNGNADGTFVQCGFKPAFVLIKAQYGEHSTIHDVSRSFGNPAKETLVPGSSGNQETASYNWIDILSNGFKARTSDYRHNKANDYLIYMAFAETPFKYATAR